MNQIVVGPATDPDLAAIVAIHGTAFPDGAITAFGAEAVRRYYAWLKDGPHAAQLTIARREGTIVGFCAAGTFRGAVTGFLQTNRNYLALRMATHPWLIASPLIRERVAQGVRLLVRARTGSTTPGVAPRFGVLAIATAPEARGSGAGRALMEEAEERARRLGFARVGLTVHPTNVNAIRFYEQLGWRREPPIGWSGHMIKDLEPRARGEDAS